MRIGKVLLITGASSDIGVEIIRKVSENYERIWAHYNQSADIIGNLSDECGDVILPIRADLSKQEDVQAMVEEIAQSEYLPDHILHLAASKTFNRQFHKCKWEDFQRGIDISLQSIVTILEAFLPGMVKKKYGKVIFMLSAYVIGVPPKFQSPYITVKYALLGLMKNLAAEYAGKGISVNGVSPDMMETKFLDDIPELIIEQNAKNHPLGRNILVSEVVPTFEYLLSDGADIVNGQNIGVSGGVEIAR